MKFQSLKDKLLVVGDICNGSSRVTGAMETSLQVFNLLNEVYSSKMWYKRLIIYEIKIKKQRSYVMKFIYIYLHWAVLWSILLFSMKSL